MNQKYLDFILEEYKNITKESSTIMSEIYELEKYSFIGFGSVYVFIFKDEIKPKSFLSYRVALPIFTTIVFGLLIFSRCKSVKLLAGYIETSFAINFGSISDTKIGYKT